MTSEAAQNDVRDNPDLSRFEIYLDGALAGFVDYTVDDAVVTLAHTRVFPQYGGSGVGSRLVVGALGILRDRGMSVLPLCPFVPKVMRDHPQLISMVPAQERSRFGLAETGTVR